MRYGEPTLHSQYGVAAALNAGDLLIGEGYRLLAASGMPATTLGAMIMIASEGQRELCRGQGLELAWQENPAPLSPAQVLEIFRRKTSPAFSVALLLGAAHAGSLDLVREPLEAFSEAVGIAYQIRDDLEDSAEDNDGNRPVRPNIIESTARERFKGDMTEATENVKMLLERYKEQAVRSLQDLENANLKGLLRRITGRMFNELEIKGWCSQKAGDTPAAAE